MAILCALLALLVANLVITITSLYGPYYIVIRLSFLFWGEGGSRQLSIPLDTPLTTCDCNIWTQGNYKEKH